MKNQQVIPDYGKMLESSITVLALVGCGWLLIKLVSACFWFPQYMSRLEQEAEKANRHLEKKLLPRGRYDDVEEDSNEITCENIEESMNDNEKEEKESSDPDTEKQDLEVEEPKKKK